MIRYVVAALLTVAILGLAVLALDGGASETTEREMQAEIAAIEAAAIDLESTEELSPAAHPNPQRVVEVSIPTRSLTRAGVSRVEIEPVNGADASIARYVLDDGTRNQDLLEARIVYRDPTDNRPTEIDGNGRQRLRLVLLPDENGGPVVVADPPARAAGPRVARRSSLWTARSLPSSTESARPSRDCCPRPATAASEPAAGSSASRSGLSTRVRRPRETTIAKGEEAPR